MFSRKEVPPPDVLYQQVVQALQLTEADVVANRAGRLSPSQQAELGYMMQNSAKSMLIIGGLVLVVAVVGFGLRLSTMGDGDSLIDFISEHPIVLVGIGGTLLLYVLMMALAFVRARQFDIENVAVKSVDGKVKMRVQKLRGVQGAVVKAGGVSTRSVMVQVGRKRIYSTNPAVEKAFVKGGLYRVYYIKTGSVGYFVSAEALRTA